MEQRDFLLYQIEQLGKVLATILSGFLGLKSKGQAAYGIEISNKQLQSELDIDIEKIISLNGNELQVYLENRKLTSGHIETMGEYLAETGKYYLGNNKQQAGIFLKKAIELLDIAGEISKTLSFDRISRKKEIEKLIQQKT